MIIRYRIKSISGVCWTFTVKNHILIYLAMVSIVKSQLEFNNSGTNSLQIEYSTQNSKNIHCPKVEEIEEDNYLTVASPCKNDEDCYRIFSDPDKRCCRRKDNTKRCLAGIFKKQTGPAVYKIEKPRPKQKKNTLENLICPSTSTKLENFNFFSMPCNTHKDCIRYAGANKRCCKGAGIINRCIDGVPRKIPKLSHFSFFGRRECPNFNDISYESGQEPLAVVFRHPLAECKEDKDCWPLRICCPEHPENDLASGKNYCQVPVTNLNNTLIKDYLGHLISHIQCTPPPPAYLDLFPKPCKSTFDCLPKVCCRESPNQNFCRPPKQNVVGLLAAMLRVFSFFFKSNP